MVRAFAVLAHLAVAAGRRLHERAVLVAEREGEAVDLRLGGERQFVVVGQAEEAADALHELGHLLGVEGVAEREHADAVADF